MEYIRVGKLSVGKTMANDCQFANFFPPHNCTIRYSINKEAMIVVK